MLGKSADGHLCSGVGDHIKPSRFARLPILFQRKSMTMGLQGQVLVLSCSSAEGVQVFLLLSGASWAEGWRLPQCTSEVPDWDLGHVSVRWKRWFDTSSLC